MPAGGRRSECDVPLFSGRMWRTGLWMAAGLALNVAAGACRPSVWPGPEATREALVALHQEVRGRVLAGDLARADGFAYAVDAGELMRVASRLGDHEMYAALRSFRRPPADRGRARRSLHPRLRPLAADAGPRRRGGRPGRLRNHRGAAGLRGALGRRARFRRGRGPETGARDSGRLRAAREGRGRPCCSSATTSTSAAGTSPRTPSSWDYAPDYVARVAPGYRPAGLRGAGGAQLRGGPRRALAGGTDLRRVPAGDGHPVR